MYVVDVIDVNWQELHNILHLNISLLAKLANQPTGCIHVHGKWVKLATKSPLPFNTNFRVMTCFVKRVINRVAHPLCK